MRVRVDIIIDVPYDWDMTAVEDYVEEKINDDNEVYLFDILYTEEI